MEVTAAEIAEQMRAAATDRVRSSELLASLFADEVELRHEPSSPFDGPMPGQVLADAARNEVAALPRAVPDLVQGDSEITLEADAVRVRGRMTGTLADGTPVDVQTNTLFSIAGGRIVGLTSQMDPASAETWSKVLAAGAATSSDE